MRINGGKLFCDYTIQKERMFVIDYNVELAKIRPTFMIEFLDNLRQEIL